MSLGGHATEMMYAIIMLVETYLMTVFVVVPSGTWSMTKSWTGSAPVFFAIVPSIEDLDDEVAGLVIVALATVGGIDGEMPCLDIGIARVGMLMDRQRGAPGAMT